jgi:hypothetical protein
MSFLSYREEHRFLSIQRAIGEWKKLSLPFSKPNLKTIAFLAGLPKVHANEVKNILEGGNQ